jgi:DNA-binding NarL/FixJ family response regulator
MPPGDKRIRTLVVDDSADFLRYLCAFLDTLPNVDVIAKGCSGRDAIVLAHEWMPDLVLMDVKMPEGRHDCPAHRPDHQFLESKRIAFIGTTRRLQLLLR